MDPVTLRLQQSLSFANPTAFTTLRLQQRKLFFRQSNHLHHHSSPTTPLRRLSPLACPLSPLLRLLSTTANARFYSQSRLATSLITPTSRRPINHHELLSRTYIPNQASHTKPTIEEIKEWDEDGLYLTTGEGFSKNTTWQTFEMFCCSFRILRSLDRRCH